MDQPPGGAGSGASEASAADAVAVVIPSTDDAYRALRENFVANADRGDNAANDDLIAAALQALRAPRSPADGPR